jgi:hypothetical protein
VLRHSSEVGSPASCSLIIPMICASVKRLFLMSSAPSQVGQTLHQSEGHSGGQVRRQFRNCSNKPSQHSQIRRCSVPGPE